MIINRIQRSLNSGQSDRGGARASSMVSGQHDFISKWLLLIGLAAVVSTHSVVGEPAMDSGYYTYEREPSPESEKAPKVSDIVVPPRNKSKSAKSRGSNSGYLESSKSSYHIETDFFVKMSEMTRAEFIQFTIDTCRDPEDMETFLIWEDARFKESLIERLMATSREADPVKLAEERSKLRRQVDSDIDTEEALKSLCKHPVEHWIATREEHEKQHEKTYNERLEDEMLNIIFSDMFSRGAKFVDHFSGHKIHRKSDKDTLGEWD